MQLLFILELHGVGKDMFSNVSPKNSADKSMESAKIVAVTLNNARSACCITEILAEIRSRYLDPDSDLRDASTR
ncbi:hypothetical protein RB195_009352 [Necator americanus]|uniref:Ras-associating domain-containing protein n=1 Tax=Necator americanus TaxID=51031 RepID=A0ABR1CSY9_NECAM